MDRSDSQELLRLAHSFLKGITIIAFQEISKAQLHLPNSSYNTSAKQVAHTSTPYKSKTAYIKGNICSVIASNSSTYTSPVAHVIKPAFHYQLDTESILSLRSTATKAARSKVSSQLVGGQLLEFLEISNYSTGWVGMVTGAAVSMIRNPQDIRERGIYKGVGSDIIHTRKKRIKNRGLYASSALNRNILTGYPQDIREREGIYKGVGSDIIHTRKMRHSERGSKIEGLYAFSALNRNILTGYPQDIREREGIYKGVGSDIIHTRKMNIMSWKGYMANTSVVNGHSERLFRGCYPRTGNRVVIHL
ncbi:hypothetical protein CEXT_20451 [Caerostris extrusa]|uniref:Ribosomal protein L2 n=1 Tax=Caerostris extrusa TaxID=172846 RepID=A0AAV4WWT6_CAEEX|nr:hypothetical protein CEXT_20451 [Caerostris extrusa]